MSQRDTAELAQTLFEEMGDAAFIVDPETLRFVDVNPLAQRMTGCPRHELLAQSAETLFRATTSEGLAVFKRALQTTRTFHSQEGYFLRVVRSGTWLPVNLSLTRLHTEKAQLGLILVRDISERQRIADELQQSHATLEQRVRERTAELAATNAALQEQIIKQEQTAKARQESEERFRASFDDSSVAMALTDLDNRFVRVNAAFGELLGLEPWPLLGQHLTAWLHPDDRGPCIAHRQAILNGARTHYQIEKRYRHANGEFLWGLTHLAIIRGVEQPSPLFVVQVQDISERRRAEEDLRQAQQRLAHVIEANPALIFTMDFRAEGVPTLTWISPNISLCLGYEYTAIEPLWWVENIHADERDQVLRRWRDELQTHERLIDEFRFRHADGSYRWLRSDVRLLHDVVGQPVEIVGSWSDITDQKYVEDQIRQSQKMEAIGRLAGGIAHDFNNLLTIINGYSELILSGLTADDTNLQLLREVVAAGERASGLTRQLLAFSRKAVIEPRILDLNVLVNDVSRMLRRIVGEDVQLLTPPTQGLGNVRADAGQTEQVLLNLVVNARDAMPRGGRITIALQNVEVPEARGRLPFDIVPGQYVQLSVSDTGIGMDASTIARVFEPFFTTKGEQGSGIGLATVHGIVKQSGGFLTVESVVGEGTTFHVFWPRVDEPATSPSGIGQLDLPQGTETILFVEDEEGVRSLIRRVLQRCGYTALEAHDGLQALMIAAEQRGTIHLLLTDVIMPGLGGREVAERLAVLHSESKVLYMSGYTDDAIVRHGVRDAHWHFIQKPFAPFLLAAKIREVLDS